jgi:hypothetical protein
LLFIVNTLLQEKYKELNAIDTPITLVPSQLSVATEDPPERTEVGTMLAAGHVAMSAFDVFHCHYVYRKWPGYIL